MWRLKLYAGTAVLGLVLAGSASADPLNIAFTIHSSPSNTFWQAVRTCRSTSEPDWEPACAKSSIASSAFRDDRSLLTTFRDVRAIPQNWSPTTAWPNPF